MSGISQIFSSSKPKELTPITPPKVAESTNPAASKEERLARAGRASLIQTSAGGVLGNAQTGRKQLSV